MSAATQFEREIREQPDRLAQLLAEGRAEAEGLARRIVAYGPTSVLIAARGSSDNAARYAQYLLGAHNRLTVALAAPSLFTLYRSPPRMERMLVIGISQSGKSPDIVSVLEEGNRQGAFTLALTNEPASPLGTTAQSCLALRAGTERAVAATKTYTTELMALAMLSAAMEGSTQRWTELEAVSGQVSRAIELNEEFEKTAARFQFAEYFVVLGRGFNYCTAFEVALKIKETSYVIAEPYSSADFLHGPIAMVERGFPVLLAAPSSPAIQDASQMADRLQQAGAELVALTDQRALLERSKTPLPLPAGTPEWLSPLVTVVPGQLFALGLAKSRGLDPDKPRGLNKVTETR